MLTNEKGVRCYNSTASFFNLEQKYYIVRREKTESTKPALTVET
ncbi:hypothetical protein [Coleofasciculus sp. E2-BRE-01]